VAYVICGGCSSLPQSAIVSNRIHVKESQVRHYAEINEDEKLGFDGETCLYKGPYCKCPSPYKN